METCKFSFISRTTGLITHVEGVERSWDDLRVEFGRTGAGLIGATHYKRVSSSGPELFAVIGDSQVYYHDNGAWYRYLTATDVQFFESNTVGNRFQESDESETIGEQVEDE